MGPSPRNRFIVLGRVSDEIASAVMSEYAGYSELKIDEPTNVIQSFIGTFPDGEPRAELFLRGQNDKFPVEQNLSEAAKKELVQQMAGAHVTIIHSISGDNATGRQIGLLGMLDYLKSDLDVGSITVIAPYMPMRNDKLFKKPVLDPSTGEMIDAPQYNAVLTRNLAKMMRANGADRVIGFTPHSNDGINHFKNYFDTDTKMKPSVRFPDAIKFMAAQFAAEHDPVKRPSGDWRIAVGAPDGLNKPRDRAIRSARNFGKILYEGTEHADVKSTDDLRDIPWMFGIHKERTSPTETEIIDFHGDVKKRPSAVVDDMYSSGGTTIQGATQLKDQGASEVFALATHGVLTNGALGRLLSSDAIDQLWVTDSIPAVAEKIAEGGFEDHEKLRYVSLAPMVLEQIEWDLANMPRGAMRKTILPYEMVANDTDEGGTSPEAVAN